MDTHCLYECDVFHRRVWPKRHEFLYKVFLFYFDIDSLAAIPEKVPFFGVNRAGLYSFWDRDHFQMVEGSPRANAEAFLREHGIQECPAKITLLSNARFLGYTFNPISIWYCWKADGSPLACIAEVGNTFGEHKPFLVPFDGKRFHSRATKHFYVSPFSELDEAFDFRFECPGERLAVWIDDYRGDERVLMSSLTGVRKELSSLGLLALTAQYPFITLKVIVLIYWQAFRLWVKRLPYIRKEANEEKQTGIFNPRK